MINGSSGASLENSVHVKNEEELKNAINNVPSKESIIALDNGITLTEVLKIPANKDITLTSKNKNDFYKLTGANAQITIVVESCGVLRLDGVIVTDFGSSGVTVRENGLLILYTGELSGNKGYTCMIGAGWFSSYGGGVYNNGTFEMYGGKISNNSAYFFASMSTGNGGGVYNSGVFKMYGSEISNNFAGTSGGVYNWGAFTMSGGKIANNDATDYGGGVSNDGSFERRGGVILGNTVNGMIVMYIQMTAVVVGCLMVLVGLVQEMAVGPLMVTVVLVGIVMVLGLMAVVVGRLLVVLV